MITVQVPDSMRDDLLQIVAASPFETDLSKVCRGAFQAAIARAKAGVATDVLAAEITHRAIAEGGSAPAVSAAAS